MDDTRFATAEDYAARYGEPTDPARVGTLLADASAYLLTEYERRWGPYMEGSHPEFDRNAAAVCCSMVNRALSVPEGMEGATQYSQAAGSYNASVTFANPSGDMYLGTTDRRKLGLVGMRVGSIAPMGEGDRPCSA